MTFKDLEIVAPIQKALDSKGYTHPTPIQQQAIPLLLEGQDLLGCAQTGTGKTAAFAIPIIQKLFNSSNTKKRPKRIKALVVTPTRELAIQIEENFEEYSKHTHLKNTVIFGGVKQGTQVNRLKQGVDILIATPGRLLDLINQNIISLRYIEYFVLDEADQMLDMGFIHDIKRIIKLLPEKRQSLFFSATMPQNIKELSETILNNHQTITIQPKQATAEKVGQSVYFVKKSDKINLLIELLQKEPKATTIVFSRTKHGADKVVKKLMKANIKAAAIHGNKSQNARQRALGAFKKGELNVLIATDIAARGIDVSDLAFVINFDLPNIPETYVHRIGRTGRAKASGEAISFCDMEERAYLRDIEKLINQKVPVISDHSFVDDSKETNEKKKPSKQKQQFRRKGNVNKGKPKRSSNGPRG
ncbi:DEAD/DEAH box helicase [Flavicella marina]|uniref:DEAD/DEAH box helicase n=1 Tax=Flavicella marina TaxID=1475951 RepID=UPI0012650837|nr:DEAD/DEAH box helicase [Flavicella marina]